LHAKDAAADGQAAVRVQTGELETTQAQLALLTQKLELERAIGTADAGGLVMHASTLQSDAAGWHMRREEDAASMERRVEVCCTLFPYTCGFKTDVQEISHSREGHLCGLACQATASCRFRTPLSLVTITRVHMQALRTLHARDQERLAEAETRLREEIAAKAARDAHAKEAAESKEAAIALAARQAAAATCIQAAWRGRMARVGCTRQGKNGKARGRKAGGGSKR
jgi:hypothetical protein